MSSFTTNRATRRGKRSRTEGYRYENALAKGGVPAKDATPLGSSTRNGNITATRLANSTIGGQHSSGLTIVSGLHQYNPKRGLNPDGRTDVPLGTWGETDGKEDGMPNSNLAEPAYPINFSGAGYPKFTSRVAIPDLYGDTTIGGDATVRGDGIFKKDILMGGTLRDLAGVAIPLGGGGGGTVASFTPVLSDGTNNATMSAQTGSTWTQDDLVHFNLKITWTGLGSMSGALRVSGLGFTATEVSSFAVHTSDGIYTLGIGNNLTARWAIGNDYLLLEEEQTSTGGAATSVTQAQLSTTGTIRITGVGVA